MDYPLALRRTAGLLVLLVVAATIVCVVTLLVFGGKWGMFVLLVGGTFFLPTLVSLPFLVVAADDVWRGRHRGNRLLFWSLVWAPAPVAFAVGGFLLGRILVGAVVLALLLYLVGTRSKYDWPDATDAPS